MKSVSLGEVGIWQRLEADVTLLINRNNCINWMDYFFVLHSLREGGGPHFYSLVGEEGW